MTHLTEADKRAIEDKVLDILLDLYSSLPTPRTDTQEHNKNELKKVIKGGAPYLHLSSMGEFDLINLQLVVSPYRKMKRPNKRIRSSLSRLNTILRYCFPDPTSRAHKVSSQLPLPLI